MDSGRHRYNVHGLIGKLVDSAALTLLHIWVTFDCECTDVDIYVIAAIQHQLPAFFLGHLNLRLAYVQSNHSASIIGNVVWPESQPKSTDRSNLFFSFPADPIPFQ